MLPTVFLP
uniref:Uncharacterized protein n=1 Tax=Anguilla anguilla TaxID=7936 RepID=A0A0E9V4D3_ANGAN